MRLWVDDIRTPLDDTYDVARTYEQAVSLLSSNRYEAIYLDHDLGCFDSTGREQTGYTLVLWIVEQTMIDPNFVPPSAFYMLTSNPVGRKNMQELIERYFGHTALKR